MQSVDDTSSKAPVEMNNQESSQPISPSQEKQSRKHEGTKKEKVSGVAGDDGLFNVRNTAVITAIVVVAVMLVWRSFASQSKSTRLFYLMKTQWKKY
jgi:hypothetical protein